MFSRSGIPTQQQSTLPEFNQHLETQDCGWKNRLPGKYHKCNFQVSLEVARCRLYVYWLCRPRKHGCGLWNCVDRSPVTRVTTIVGISPGNQYFQPPSWVSRCWLNSDNVDRCCVGIPDLEYIMIVFGIFHLCDSRAELWVFQFFQPPSWISRCHTWSHDVTYVSTDFAEYEKW